MKFFITTPIYYVNDKPHVGHAYTTLAADILARYHRQIGDEVWFLTGTDEHGAKVAEAAEKAGKSPQEFADEVSYKFKSVWDSLGISYDRFIRTTDKDHIATVKDFLTKLNNSGFIYPGEYRGLYCRGCEAFKRPGELVDGKCPDHGTVPEEISEPTYFFKLSAFKVKLTELIASKKFIIEPEIRRNEVLSFLEGQDLEDIAISRSKVTWGISLPWDDKQTIYVWIDALINYYTEGRAKNIWPPNWQIMAKDIIRFHCVIWPAMLLALSEELPGGVFAHGFFTVDDQKMSKSLGNVVDPHKLVENYSPDAIRLFLFRAFPFGNDGDFSYSLLNEVYNDALSNELGNLVQRVLVMVQKYRNGIVPDIGDQTSNLGNAIVGEIWDRWHQSLQTLRLDEAYKAVWDLVKLANQRIDETRPWDLAKSDDDRLNEVLYELLEIIRHLSLMLVPLLPETAVKIAGLINVEINTSQTLEKFNLARRWGGLASGHKVKVGDVLFPRKEAD